MLCLLRSIVCMQAIAYIQYLATSLGNVQVSNDYLDVGSRFTLVSLITIPMLP